MVDELEVVEARVVETDEDVDVTDVHLVLINLIGEVGLVLEEPLAEKADDDELDD